MGRSEVVEEPGRETSRWPRRASVQARRGITGRRRC